MKANLKNVRKVRHYSEDFKREIVSVFESGKLSVLQLEKLYGISNSLIYNWIYKLCMNHRSYTFYILISKTVNTSIKINKRL